MQLGYESRCAPPHAFDVMLDTEDVIGMSSYPIAKQILTKLGVDLG